MAGWGADGVIVGSAIVKILGEANSPEQGLKDLENFTRSLTKSLDTDALPWLLCDKSWLISSILNKQCRPPSNNIINYYYSWDGYSHGIMERICQKKKDVWQIVTIRHV